MNTYITIKKYTSKLTLKESEFTYLEYIFKIHFYKLYTKKILN